MLFRSGRVDYDGRPIFKIPCDDFVYELKKISDDVEVIPAHCLTPWFSIFGSNSGYNTVEECFKDQTKNVYALETGISADPSMIYRVEDWRKYTLVSNSDSHSFWPWRNGREATLFDMKKITYKNFIKSIREKTIAGTIEVDPSYGKYHYTGHRNCNIVMNPADGLKIHNMCPKCKSKMTVGVASRVEELADKPEGFMPKDAPKYYSLLPLSELISGLYKTPIASKKTWEVYNKLLLKFGNEFEILLNADLPELLKIVDEKLANLIIDNRHGKIKVKPGFDGVYGIPLIHGDEDYDFSETDAEMKENIDEWKSQKESKTKYSKNKKSLKNENYSKKIKSS